MVYSVIDFAVSNSRSQGDGGAIYCECLYNNSLDINLEVDLQVTNSTAYMSGGAMAVVLPAMADININISGSTRGTRAVKGSGGSVSVNSMGQTNTTSSMLTNLLFKDLTITNSTSKSDGGAVLIRTFDNTLNTRYSFVNCQISCTAALFGSGGAIGIIFAGGITVDFKLNLVDVATDRTSSGSSGGGIAILSLPWIISGLESTPGQNHFVTRTKGVVLNGSVSLSNVSILHAAATRYASNGGGLHIDTGPWGETPFQTVLCGDPASSLMQVAIDARSSFINCSAANSGGALFMTFYF
jgi:hypothetical protein